MSTPKVYVLCEQNCRWEGMTKEQILAAITQAVESHEITDVDTGFVTTIKTINGVGLKFFIGTQAAWAELSAAEKDGVFAIFSDDNTGDALKKDIEDLQAALATILDGTQTVQKARETDFTNAEWQLLTADTVIDTAGIYEFVAEVDFGSMIGSVPIQDYKQFDAIIRLGGYNAALSEYILATHIDCASGSSNAIFKFNQIVLTWDGISQSPTYKVTVKNRKISVSGNEVVTSESSVNTVYYRRIR